MRSSHSHSHSHSHTHDHGHSHGQDYDYGHRHSHGHSHDHDRDHSRSHSRHNHHSSSSSSSSQSSSYSSSSSSNSSIVMPTFPPSSSQHLVMSMATDTLILRGIIPPEYTYEGLREVVKVYGPVESVRIIRDRATGESKGYSFASFSSPREAHNLLANSGGCIRLPGVGTVLTMEFVRSDPRFKIAPGTTHVAGTDPSASCHPRRTNWICPVCRIDNFARRDFCFKCNFPRPTEPASRDEPGATDDKQADRREETKEAKASEEKSVYDESISYTTTIVVKGLSSETDERALLGFFSRIAPVKSVRLARDKETGYSRGLCHVEFYCIDDADGAVKLTNGTVIERGGFPVSVTLSGNGLSLSKPSEECLGVASGTLAFRYTGGPVQLIDTEGNFVYGNSFGTTDKATLDAWMDYAKNLKMYIEATQAAQSGEVPGAVAAAVTQPNSNDENGNVNANVNDEMNSGKNGELNKESETKNESKCVESKESEEDINASLDEFFKDLNQSVENISTISAAPVKNEIKPEQIEEAKEESTATSSTNKEDGDDLDAGEMSFDSVADPIGRLIPDTVCVLCMRQLPSVEALQKHIELSKLHKYHKERLEEERKLKRKPCSSELEEIEQEERMGERSALYKYLDIKYPMKKRQRKGGSGGGGGPDYDKMATAMIRAQLKARAEENEGKVSVDKEISESNIGSKMLKKMGWSHGEGLGKDGDGIKAPIPLVSYEKHAGVGSSVGIQINPGDTYTERARKYAMMLYEESRKKTEQELNANPNYNGIN